MGDIETDIAVIKNDIAHIKTGIDEIKNSCRKRDEDCECKFAELFNAKSDQSVTLENIKGRISFYDKALACLGALTTILIAACGVIVTWLRGG